MMRHISAFVIAGILLLGAGPLRAENIQRSCNAIYSLTVSDIRDSSNNMVLLSVKTEIPLPRGANNKSLWRFTARRGCGSAVPNRCRERAGKAALACMLAHVKTPARKPDVCTKDGVRDYPFDNLDQAIREQVCSWAVNNGHFSARILPPTYRVNAALWGYVAGDTGCGGPGKSATPRRVIYTTAVHCPM